jgi:ubiquinone/menaquinone biosynthesis C-methylase UbiE
MELKDYFDNWMHTAAGKYDRKQWLLSKWEVCDGIEWPKEKVAVMVQTIVDGARLDRKHVVADLGCGGGWIADRLRRQVRAVIGLDFCWDVLSVARSRGVGPWVQGAIGQLPLKTESLDRAISYFVFLNFSDDRFVECALLDIMRVLKIGGVALIGQMPDADGSADYEREKASYYQYCKAVMKVGDRNDEESRAVLRLFDRGRLKTFLNARGIRHEFRPSFNPFYRPGAQGTVPWRFDLLLFKD